MAITKLTYNSPSGITFNNVSSPGATDATFIGKSKILCGDDEQISQSDLNEYGLTPILQALQIDWNGAQVSGETLNTTGEMLSILQTAYNYATTYNVKYSNGRLYDDIGTEIKVGSNYDLPTASSDVLGGVKVGDGLNISDGKLSVDSTYYVTASDLIARSYITTSDADEKYAYKYHAYDGTTYGIGTADLYGHLKISSAYTTYTSATDIALSLKGAYYMYKLFVDEIDKLNKRIEILESYHAPKPVTSVTVEPSAYTYYGRGIKKLAYSITPTDAAITSVTWASSNDTFVEVTQTGYFTTKKPTVTGSYVIITATTTSNDGSSKCGYCYVTVNEARIDRVDAGDNITLTYDPNSSQTITIKPYHIVKDYGSRPFNDTFTYSIRSAEEGHEANIITAETPGKFNILSTGISYIDVTSNVDDKKTASVLVTIENQVTYYWYAGWTAPDADNIATIVNETYPAGKSSTTMNPAGKSATSTDSVEMDYSTANLYNRSADIQYYVVVPNGQGIYDSIGTRLHLDDAAFTIYSSTAIANHTIYISYTTSRIIDVIIKK